MKNLDVSDKSLSLILDGIKRNPFI